MEPDFRPKLIALFEGWLDGSIKISDVDCGICSNVEDTIHVSCNEYNRHFRTWDKYAGNIDFPIPSTNKKYNSGQYYCRNTNLWIGKQGKLRRDLLRHLIKCLKAEMEVGNV